MKHKWWLTTGFWLLLGLVLYTQAPRSTVAESLGDHVIGDGTVGSCELAGIANQLSQAVEVGGVIWLNCGPEPVTIISNTNATDKTVVVNGNGRVTLSGEDLRQVFYLFDQANLTLNNVNVLDGNSYDGGGIYIGDQAQATINGGYISSNEAYNGYGGGIYNNGTLYVNGTYFGSNVAITSGGAIFNNGGTAVINDAYFISNYSSNDGGALFNSGGSVAVERSAFRSNTAVDAGAGIYSSLGSIEILNSTFSNNKADRGAGLFKDGPAVLINNTFNANRADLAGAVYNWSGSSFVRNNIFANSLDEAGSGPSLNCDGPSMSSDGFNIISDNSCLPNPGTVGDLFSTDPQLDVWRAHPVGAHALLASSPAIDYGFNCPAIDQNGRPRPIGDGCDVGSIEYGWVVYLPVVIR